MIHLANSGWPTARWWEGYQDPQLNMLVNRALQNSPTMQAARLRISQSQSTVELAQSAMGVQATAVAAQNRLRVTNKQFTWPYSFSLPVDKNGPWYTLNTVGVGATLNIDLWAPTAPASPPRLAKRTPPGGDRRYRAGSRQQRGSALFRDAGNFSENRITQPVGGYRPPLGAGARASYRARRRDSVDVANAQAELLAARSR
ncbi:tripartite multidrug resistance system outer membrane protein [Klebsiella michiganensis]|uniref:Tripartite multidrug resistance system outer membrane protein n=1 Tax=Klebsiella michiganensis TaxID=1134687 RepID=A0A7H4M6L8_9ENTR|nr:tripartite multidrug resistance system outer membrane protein [Klebsiella michiganensis]